MSKLILLSDDDYEFLVGFDPDRDRVASRADMVGVVRHVQTAVLEGLLVDVEGEISAESRRPFEGVGAWTSGVCLAGSHSVCLSGRNAWGTRELCACSCHRDQAVT